MTPEELDRERLKSASDLDGVVENAQGEPEPRSSTALLGPADVVRMAVVAGPQAQAPAWDPPTPPDLQPVNESWTAGGKPVASGLASLVDGGREKTREAQVRFNGDQVQLDNALVTWVAAHFAATHQHYDNVVAQMQTRMDDIDTRHRELERELVRHVHEMARRIDVVLGEGEKGRVSHEAALRSVRERLRLLEEKLR